MTTVFGLIANQATTDTKPAVDSAINLKAHQPTTYTITKVYNDTAWQATTAYYASGQLALKANQSTTDTMIQVDTAFALTV